MLATFSIVTTENLPAGLLPQMADGLGVSLSATGQLVTGYALTVAIFAIPLTYATNRIPRRPLLLALMTLFVLASLWSAIAPDYLSLLASRAVMAVITVAAAGLFSPSVRGRVIAIVYSASSVANIVGVPAGAWLGQQAGWRSAFVALTVLGMLALVAIVIWLPTTTARQVQTTERSTPNNRRYAVLLVVIVVSMIGLSMAFTYTVPFLTDVSGFSTQAISLLLLLRAGAGVVVLTAAGSLADRHPRLASIVPLVLLAVSFLGMYLLGRTLSSRPCSWRCRVSHCSP